MSKFPTLKEVTENIKRDEEIKTSRSSILSSVSQLDGLMKSLEEKEFLNLSLSQGSINPYESNDIFNPKEEEEIEIIEDYGIRDSNLKHEEEEEEEEDDDDELESEEEGEDDYKWESNVSSNSNTPFHDDNVMANPTDYSQEQTSEPTIRSSVADLNSLSLIKLEPGDNLLEENNEEKEETTRVESNEVDEDPSTSNKKKEGNSIRIPLPNLFNRKKKSKKKRKRGWFINPWCCCVLCIYGVGIWMTNFLSFAASLVLVFRGTYFSNELYYDIIKASFYGIHFLFISHGWIIQILILINCVCRPSVYSLQIRKSIYSVVYHSILSMLIVVYFVYGFGSTCVFYFYYYQIFAYVFIPIDLLLIVFFSCFTFCVYDCCLYCCIFSLKCLCKFVEKEISKERSVQSPSKSEGIKEEERRRKIKEMSGIGFGKEEEGEYQFQSVYKDVERPLEFSDL